MAKKRQVGNKADKAVKKVTVKSEKKVESTTTDILWKVLTGSLTYEGKIYNPGDTVKAPKGSFKAFKDTVQPVLPKDYKAPKPVIKFAKVEVEVSEEDKGAEDFVQTYNVVNKADKAINPAPLTEDEADVLLAALNA